MKGIIILIDLIILLFLAGFFVFFIHQLFHIFFKGYAPFLPTKKKAIKKILNEVDLADDAVIYELGCGRAGFLQAARKKFPDAKLTGFENSFLLFWQAKIQNWLKGAKLTILKRNLFMVDLSSANLIYCYLNESMMKRLLRKFKKELAHGTSVISFQHKIPTMEPTKIIKGAKETELVYFYQF